MKSIFSLLDEMSHQLKSPLASAKSYVYLSKRLVEKGDREKTDEYLTLLDGKIDLFAQRVELVLTAFRLEIEPSKFTYEIFNVSDIVNADPDIEIMADREMLRKIFTYAKEITGNDSPEVSKQGTHMVISMPIVKRADPVDKDEKTDLMEKEIIMYQLVKHHGGTINETEKELSISIPLKPKAK